MPDTRNQSLLLDARTLGIRARESNYPCAPIQDLRLMDMLRGRAAGITPDGEPNSADLTQSWIEGWRSADVMAGAPRRRATG